MYRSNPRNDMNELLSALVKDALVARELKLDKLVMEHVVLVATLSGNVGNEIGAFFLQYFVKLFDKMSKENVQVENKELDSVVLIIVHLYNFKVRYLRIFGFWNQFFKQLSFSDCQCETNLRNHGKAHGQVHREGS